MHQPTTHVIDDIDSGNWKQKAECRSRSKGEVVKEVKVWRRGGGRAAMMGGTAGIRGGA